MVEAVVALAYGLSKEDFHWIMNACDNPTGTYPSMERAGLLNAKGFWRVDKEKSPEHRQSVLSTVAFLDLLEACNSSNSYAAVEAFLGGNNGEGWQLPETLRLADYGLGHDDRAREHQPVRSHFGPRFYDWQLEQSPEDSWQECHLHARNLLGPTAYQTLLDELNGKTSCENGREDNTMQIQQRNLF